MNLRRQRGVALITVLMVFFFAVTIASAMTARQHLDIKRTSNLSEYIQASQYANAAEDFAILLLREDFQQGKEVDHSAERWSQPDLSFEVDNGVIDIRLVDLQGRLNLNELAGENAPSTKARLQLLLTRLGINPELAEAVRDWIDEDEQRAGLAGAEDNDYLLLDPPYRAANAPLRDVSELRLLAGMNEEYFLLLRDHVSTLPPGTSININTAGPLVLQSLSQDLGQIEAEQISLYRENAAFVSVADDFLTQAFVPASVSPEGLDVRSEYFMLQARARYGDRTAQLESLIWRDENGNCHILQRTMGRKFPRSGTGQEQQEA